MKANGYVNYKAFGIGTRNIATYHYKPNNGYLDYVSYGNGFTESYIYDIHGNVSETKRGDTIVLKNFADSIGNIIRTQDLTTNLEHRISYDYIGRPISKEVLDLSITGNADKWLRSVEYSYDVSNNLNKFTYADADGSNVTSYTYTDDNLLHTTTLNNGNVLTYNHDNLGRLTGKVLKNGTTELINSSYTYLNSARGTVTENGVTKTYTTTKLATETVAGTKYRYTYDAVGNIKRIYSVASDNTETLLHLYMYDNANQLTADMDTQQGIITDYGYDESGNILQKKVSEWNGNAQIITRGTELSKINYAYGDTNGWGDLLTSYNGQTITYDAIGNPLNYRDGINLTWQNGRQLATFSQTDGASVSYTYDASGMRTGKTVTVTAEDGSTSSVAYTYVYENGLLLQMTRGSRVYDFMYDANGTPVSIAYRTRATANPQYYYYVTNSRGDVVALYNSSGSITALYEYDAYGNVTVKSTNGLEISSETHIGNVNPLRYRGYVYDTETGFYYLQSRYYDPITCRFINGDKQLNTNTFTGHNQFAYCDNNPIMCYDYTGEATIWDAGGGSTFNMGGGPKIGGGGGGSSSGTFSWDLLFMGLGLAATATACTMVSHQTDGMRGEMFLVRAATEVLVKAAEEATPVYYGADIRDDALHLTTLPMDFATATVWATTTASIHTYSRNKSWGLYTKDSEDAYTIALFLGGGNSPIGSEVHGEGQSGYYYHYHTHNHKFMGYKYFHLWYGNPT